MESSSDCAICMENITTPYQVQCGSKTPHLICDPCEIQWRLKSRATPEGRSITCPLCRAVEGDTSKRSIESLQAELSHVYFELATKTRKSTEINQGIRDYVRILESIAMVPNIQLDGLSMVPSDQLNRIMVPLEETRLNRQRRQEIQRQSDFYARMAREEAERQARATAAIAARREAAARQAAERRERRNADAVWCESGNLTLGACTTSRRTTRPCSYAGCTKRVCFRCDQCISH